MKQGKKPTYEQRKLLAAYGLNTYDWLVSKDTSGKMVLVHRYTDQIRTIPKNT